MRAPQIRKEEMGLHVLGARENYFEGWYFRLCDPRCSLAVIVGVQRSAAGRAVFIQTLDTLSGESQWAEFAWDAVSVRQTPFHLKLGANEFSLTKLKLNLPSPQVNLRFSDLTPPPVFTLCPDDHGTLCLS